MSQLDDEKLVYERIWTLLRDPALLVVFEEHGVDAFRRSCVLEGFEKFVIDSGFRGRCCVEIGTLTGLTAIILSRYFEHVVTIDVVEHPLAAPIARLFGTLNIERIVVRDNTEKARVIEGLEFDAAFVDGDHARDTESDFALVKRCGHVLFHEYWPAQPAVVALVDRLPGPVVTNGKWAKWGPA